MSFSEELVAKYPSLHKFTGSDYVESHDGRETALLRYIYNHPTLEEKRNSPSGIRQLMDEFAAQEDFLINIGKDKANKLEVIIAEQKPTVAVELGGYVGYSALCFGEVMRQAAGNAPTNLRLWSIEFDPLIASIAMNLIDLAGLSDIVKVVVGTAADSLQRLHAQKVLTTVDFLFLDHVEDLYVPDFQICEELGLFKQGTLIVADNVLRPGAPAYREYVRPRPTLESWSIKGLIMPGEFEDELEITRVK
ncbi:S-adenosyl-L-methionine-dependent methyltransferase [Penicillium macrosclerotiorum]|uniref:S-adenosyl-L-methionine-dependent methyltransferase n=1 Tax=Penicillium macrosclerotiorum TaxID=303699 RepID=UPI002546D6DA|nr:S-adenosyl-L-methionine-dependent methyltransferase [Penicillium macrosclerotiorum]KAJ5682379.1 S-adenosyl-L-methionine-dependent methyltransferase [Penicillium macrosclerotiorum]